MTETRTEPAGWSALLERTLLPRVVVACLAVWLHAADELIITTLAASVIADIGGADRVFWAFTLYETGSVVAGAVAALLAIRHGLARVMAAAALAYMAGCVLAAVAPAMEVLLAGRLLQGAGGGGLTSLAIMLASTRMPAHLVARSVAAISAFWGLSAFLGPLIGGLFAEASFWRGAFWLFAGKAALLAIGIPLVLRRDRDDTRTPAPDRAAGAAPAVRLALLAAGVTAVALGGVTPDPVMTPVWMLGGLALIALFLARDARSGAARMLPRALYHGGDPVRPGMIMLFCFSVVIVPLSAYGPVLMIGLQGISALTAGYIVAAVSFGWSGAAIATAGLPARHEGRAIGIGFALVAATVPGFAWAVGHGPVWLIALLALAEGAGFGMAWTFLLKRMTSGTDQDENQRISGALQTVSRMGYALGAGFCGLIANSAGFSETMSPTTARSVAGWVFVAVLPAAAAGLLALRRHLIAPQQP